MKIAFDVKGTLDGYHGVKMRNLFKRLHDAGHEMFVWSNSIAYAHEMGEKLKLHGLNLEICSKYSKYDAEERELPLMDLAIEDDTSQNYLAAKRIAFVHDMPENEEFMKLLSQE